MSSEFSRARRVGEQIRRILAELIREEIKDPRIGMVTLTAVEVSRDLSHAKVFFTVLNDDPEAIDATHNTLRRAAGYLRRELGRQVKLRLTPELHFEYDQSVQHGSHMMSLINSVKPESDGDD